MYYYMTENNIETLKALVAQFPNLNKPELFQVGDDEKGNIYVEFRHKFGIFRGFAKKGFYVSAIMDWAELLRNVEFTQVYCQYSFFRDVAKKCGFELEGEFDPHA